MRYLNGYASSRRNRYWDSVRRLIGHLVGTAVIFSAVLILAWALSYLAHGLNGIYQFPPEIYLIVTKIEYWLVIIDVVISSIVLLAGAARFIRDILLES